MSKKVLRRVVAGAGSVALAGGMVATVGAGLAAAAPIPSPTTWSDGNSQFTRTIDNATPHVGDTITLSTAFQRKWAVEDIYNYKDLHDGCLAYVPGSAKWEGSAIAKVTETPGAPGSQASVTVESPSLTAWAVPGVGSGWGAKRTISMQFVVGSNCQVGTDLMTTMHYGGSLGSGVYQDKGPTINASKSASTTALAPVQNAQVGQASTLTATVTGGKSGDPVDFYDAGTKIGSGALDGAGKATFQWTPTVKGAHSLQAKFPDTASATGSQSAVQNVNATQANVNSSVALGAVSGAQVGKASTLTATVTPSGAGGTVTFKDGAATIASATVGADSKATYNWTPATAGDHAITAEFSGRDGVSASTGGPVTVTVADKPAESTPSTTALNDVTGAQVGKATTVSAKVTPATAGGTVTFKDGDTVIGTAQVGTDGIASTTWTPATAGQRTLAAEFSGNGNVTASSDQASVSVAAGTGGGTPGTPGTGSSTGSLSNLLGGFGSSK